MEIKKTQDVKKETEKETIIEKSLPIDQQIIRNHMQAMERTWSQDKPSKKSILEINEDYDHKSSNSQ